MRRAQSRAELADNPILLLHANREATLSATSIDQAGSGATGTPSLEDALQQDRPTVEIQALCYGSTDRSNTEFWVRAGPINSAAVLSEMTAQNPDVVSSNITLVNKDVTTTNTGNFSLFKRWYPTSSLASYGGQSGMKWTCASNGQIVMPPDSPGS